MTPEIEKKRRELFEAWAADTFYAGLDTPASTWNEERGIYEDAAHWMAWCSFNAALDAVEIVFPSQRDEKYQDYYDGVEGGSFNYSRYLNDVRNAITTTGLGLRIK